VIIAAPPETKLSRRRCAAASRFRQDLPAAFRSHA
jgi:hypothetical protein